MPAVPGVFNVTDPTWNILVGNGASTNRINLQAMIVALLSSTGPTGGNGGTIEFPSLGTYKFSGAPIVIGPLGGVPPVTVPNAIIIQGDGQGSAAVPLLQKTDGGDLFQVNNTTTANANVGGVTFRDLYIDYNNTDATSGAAIHVVSGLNVRVLRCVFSDCPVAVFFEDSGQCNMIDCTVIYPALSTNVGTGLVLGDNMGDSAAIETYVAGCVFESNSSPPGGVGIQINNVEHVRVVNTRIEQFEQGITITPGGSTHNARKLYFGNVSCFPTSSTPDTATGAAVLIQPTNSAWAVEIWFDCCELDAPDNAGSLSYTGAGVVVDPVNGAGGGGFIDQIRFTDCHVCRWNGPGLQLIGGSGTPILTNVEILGGYYSLNGANPAAGLPAAGIAIGSASGVRISNAACDNSVYFSGGFLTPTQDYGISFASGAQDVFVRGCDLRGNLTQAVAPISGVTNVQITNSAGYNDQATLVRATPPGPSSFNGTTYGYHGPVEFYTTGGGLSQIAIDTNNTNLTSGSFRLGAGESAVLTYTGTPTFIMIGK